MHLFIWIDTPNIVLSFLIDVLTLMLDLHSNFINLWLPFIILYSRVSGGLSIKHDNYITSFSSNLGWTSQKYYNSECSDSKTFISSLPAAFFDDVVGVLGAGELSGAFRLRTCCDESSFKYIKEVIVDKILASRLKRRSFCNFLLINKVDEYLYN